MTAPQRADLLAESVTRLLHDPELRARLSERGRAHVLDTYPPWPEAGAAFHRAVGALVSRARSTGG